jgi:hypothetical protein
MGGSSNFAPGRLSIFTRFGNGSSDMMEKVESKARVGHMTVLTLSSGL